MLIVLDHGQAATFVDLAAALQQALLAHAEEADLPADAIRLGPSRVDRGQRPRRTAPRRPSRSWPRRG